MKRSLLMVGLWAAALIIGLLLQDAYYIGIATVTAFLAVWGQSWNIIGGLGGELSLGHSAFIAVGAYITVVLFQDYGVPPLLGTLIAVGVAVVFAAFIGVATLRLRGPYFALATLSIAAVLLSIIVHFKSVTGGANGLSLVFGTSDPAHFEFENPKSYYAIAMVLLLLVTAITAWIYRSKLGLYLRASGASEAAAAAAGIRIAGVRILALCISAALTALGGVFYVFYAGFADPNYLSGLNLSIDIALIAVVGGRNYLAGPIVGAIFFQVVDSTANAYAGSYPGWNIFIFGLVVVLVVLVEPRGLLALGERSARLVRRRATRTSLESA